MIPAIFRNKQNFERKSDAESKRIGTHSQLKTDDEKPKNYYKSRDTRVDRFHNERDELKFDQNIFDKDPENYTLSNKEIEIARLLSNKKGYDPSLIKNVLQEQEDIRNLARIIINLKEKSGENNKVTHENK